MADAKKATEKAKKIAAQKAKNEGVVAATVTQEEEDSDEYCEKCAKAYTDADIWVGCDICETWCHYQCAGIPAMLTEEDEWLCEYCLTQ